MAEEDESSSAALLEWVNSLAITRRSSAHVQRLEDVADGQLLLQVMHDVVPRLFPAKGAVHMHCLLEGLSHHFHARAASGSHSQWEPAMARAGRQAEVLKDQAVMSGGFLEGGSSLGQLTLLVLLATIENDNDMKQQAYMEAAQNLSQSGMKAIGTMLQDFQQLESASPSSPHGHSGMLSPVSHHLRRRSGFEFAEELHKLKNLEAKYKALQERVDELERDNASLYAERGTWQEDRDIMRRELEDERQKRKVAEGEERRMFEELQGEAEAREKVREAHRTVFAFEVAKMEANFDRERRELQEETAAAQQATSELKESKRLLEQQLRRERSLNDELQAHSDRLAAGSSNGNTDSVQRQVDKLKADRKEVCSQRDEAEDRARKVEEELEKGHREVLQLREELSRLKRERPRSESPAGMAPRQRSPGGSRLSDVTDEARQFLQKLDTPSGRTTRPPPLPLDRPSSRAESPRTTSPQNGTDADRMNLMEKWIAEKERVTEAEITLGIQKHKITTLEEEVTKAAARVKELEEELATRAAVGQADGSSGTHVRELQGQLTQRETELEVYRYRSRTDSNALAMQEALMSSCFHEIGLQFHKLRLQHEILRKQGVRPEVTK